MNIIKKAKGAVGVCRINESFLAIPFGVTAAFISSKEMPDIKILLCILTASICGFMAGNVFNGIADMKIDSANPRTENRPLIQREINVKEAFAIIILLGAGVIISTWLIDFIYVLLLPLPMSLCFLYSLSKRYTWLCHAIIGIVNAVPAVGSWIVFNGWRDFRFIIMGMIILFWTVGFEMIYSSQDVEYDKLTGMKSMPAVFGIVNGYKISIVSYIITAALFVILMYLCKTGIIFAGGVLIGVIILAYQHVLVWGGRVYNAGRAFKLNKIFSVVIMLSAVSEKLIIL